MKNTEEITLLVIDDDEMITYAIQSVFGKKGYGVLTASNGEEGLKLLRERAGKEKKIDLIILDVLMPKMDGWSFIRQLRSSKEFLLVPVIFLSSLQDSQNRLRGFELGADDYLAKPFRLEELEFRIKNVLQKFRHLNNQIHPKEPGLQGSLEQLGFATLLHVLQMELRTGVLSLDGDGMKAEIFLKGGELLEAHLSGGESAKGREVVYTLLTWKNGSFSFVPQIVDRENQIQLPLVELLLEGARRIDEKQMGG